MLQKLLNNPHVQSILARIWKKFKQKNPTIAFIIMIAMNSIVLLPVLAPDFNIKLPSWVGILVVFATFWNSFNGTNTYEFLENDNQANDPVK